jgi:hypothetical protein
VSGAEEFLTHFLIASPFIIMLAVLADLLKSAPKEWPSERID